MRPAEQLIRARGADSAAGQCSLGFLRASLPPPQAKKENGYAEWPDPPVGDQSTDSTGFFLSLSLQPFLSLHILLQLLARTKNKKPKASKRQQTV